MTGWVDLAPLAERGITMRYGTEGRDMVALNSPAGWEVEQPWLWWITGGSGGFPDWGPPVWGTPPEGALSPVWGLTAIPAVTRCTGIICDTLAGLPWHIFRGFEQMPTPEWVSDPNSLRIDARVHDPLRAPEVRYSSVEFWTQWLISALWLGDGLIYVPVRGAGNQPQPPIWLLDPLSVNVEDDRYYIDDLEMEPGSIIHLRRPPIVEGRGTGVLMQHAQDLGLSLLTRGYAVGQFRTGVPPGYIKLNAPNVTRDQAENVRAEWMATHGRGRRSIAVLSALAEFNPIAVKPIDAQLADQRQWNVRDVALIFGVPPYMLGIPGDSATYANVESRLIELTRFTHLPWARRIESTLDAQVARGVGFKVRLDGLMRADTMSRYQAYKIALEGGWLTLEEIRQLEDYPPLPAGSTPMPPVLPPTPVGPSQGGGFIQ